MPSANKTQPTQASVTGFLDAVENDQKRADSYTLMAMMEEITGEHPVMWGPSMVGFGSYHYRYASGREGDYFRCGFSPRKGAISIYLPIGQDSRQAYLDRLGKHRTGVGCLYVNKLADIDLDVLRELIVASLASLPGDTRTP